MNAARQELGLAPVREVFDQFHVLAPSLVLTSREYDFVPPGLPEQVRYVGPQLDDPAWPEPWTPPWSTDVRVPLVVATLGSTYQRQEKSFAAIVQALGACCRSADSRRSPTPVVARPSQLDRSARVGV